MNAATLPINTPKALWLHSLDRAYSAVLTGRSPTKFEVATAEALWRATAVFDLATPPRKFQVVSAATGSGKTLGAVALIAHRFPQTATLVVKEMKAAHEHWRQLVDLIGDEDLVAITTGVHRKGGDVAKYERETGLKVTRQYSDAEVKAAPIVVVCHQKWLNEVNDGADRGVRLCNGVQRDLIVVDEDPTLEVVYVAQPEDVTSLCSLLGETIASNEGRTWGFSDSHQAMDTLNNIAARMQSIKHHPDTAQLQHAGDIILDDEIDVIAELTKGDVRNRMREARCDIDRISAMNDVLGFLHAASEGRTFYHRRAKGGQFLAYSWQTGPQPKTLILDGTSDVNYLYRAGTTIELVEDVPKADYRDVKLTYNPLPQELRSLMDPDVIGDRRYNEPLADWLRDYVIANTEPGEKVLVYCKLAFVKTGVHRKDNDDPDNKDASYTEWQGRQVWFQSFGAGRGSNVWRECTAYFQLGAFYMPKGVYVARLGSASGTPLSPDDLKKMSGRDGAGSRTEQKRRLNEVRDSLVMADTKQNAARTCIRQLDDQGVAKGARMFFLGMSVAPLLEYVDDLFPGHRGLELEGDAESVMTGAQRLVKLLRETDEDVLLSGEIVKSVGMARTHLGQLVKSKDFRHQLRGAGWSYIANRKAVGVSGKGWCLVRHKVEQVQ